MPRKGKTVLDGYLTEDQQARELGVAVRTLRKWRACGEGPAFVRVGGKRVLYAVGSAAAWLKAREQKPVRSAA